jgi:hypothetical protein
MAVIQVSGVRNQLLSGYRHQGMGAGQRDSGLVVSAFFSGSPALYSLLLFHLLPSLLTSS